MENDRGVQKGGYLYFRNITLVAVRRVDRMDTLLSWYVIIKHFHGILKSLSHSKSGSPFKFLSFSF